MIMIIEWRIKVKTTTNESAIKQNALNEQHSIKFEPERVPGSKRPDGSKKEEGGFPEGWVNWILLWGNLPPPPLPP